MLVGFALWNFFHITKTHTSYYENKEDNYDALH
jgi:hypothetical protein